MQTLVVTIGGFVGGLFFGIIVMISVGALRGLLSVGKESPAGFGGLGILLVAIFGFGLFYSMEIIFSSLPMLLGVCVSIAYDLRGP